MPSLYLEIIRDKDVLTTVTPSIAEVFNQTESNIRLESEGISSGAASNKVLIQRFNYYLDELAYVRDMLDVAISYVQGRTDSLQVDMIKAGLIQARMKKWNGVEYHPNGSRDTVR